MRKPHSRYTAESYRRCVKLAVKRANAARAKAADRNEKKGSSQNDGFCAGMALTNFA
jgi:hypothetical protein